MLTFAKATKAKSKLRLAVFGPSGAGKTYSALRIASGMGDKIAVIDTERGSASKYADRFTFDVLDLPTKTIDVYVEAIKAAAAAGYPVLIIDSLSHGWQELLEEIDRMAKAKYKGNTWSAWSEGTPKQRRLVDAILEYPGHVIATMRSKTEWTTSTDDRGKSRPERVGLAPEQGKGIEYEFDMLMEMSVDHVANVIKDRTGKYQDALINKPDETFGKDLVEWLNSGETVAPKPATQPAPKPVPSAKSNGNGHKAEQIADEPNTIETAKELGGVEKKLRLEPATLKAALIEKAATFKGVTQADQKIAGVVVANLEKCFAGNGGNPADKRHEFLKFVTGHASIKDVDPKMVLAINAWLAATQDSGGDWQPCDDAVREARAAVVYYEMQNGQQELL